MGVETCKACKISIGCKEGKTGRNENGSEKGIGVEKTWLEYGVLH